jgi:hypothetical protein
MNRLSIYGLIFGAVLVVFLALAMPGVSLAQVNADKGAMVVNVIDENGMSFSGNWSLHRGANQNVFPIIRNGAKGEKFQVDPGIYFLEVQLPSDGRYQFKSLRSENPQIIEAGVTYNFNIQYFRTEEQKLAADAEPYTMKTASAKPVVAPVVVKPAPAPVVTAPTPAKATPAVKKPTQTPAPVVEVSPDADWITDAPAAAVPVEANRPMQLAVTGPSGSWVLVLTSILLAGLVFKFRRA